MKTKWIECECWNSDHAVRLSWFEEQSLSPEDPMFYLDVKPSARFSFFKRILIALRYVFKAEKHQFCYQETLIYKDKAIELKNFIEERLKETEKNAN